MNGPIIDCTHAMELLTNEESDQIARPDRLCLRVHLLYCRACASFRTFQVLPWRNGPEFDQSVELDTATQNVMQWRLLQERNMK